MDVGDRLRELALHVSVPHSNFYKHRSCEVTEKKKILSACKSATEALERRRRISMADAGAEADIFCVYRWTNILASALHAVSSPAHDIRSVLYRFPTLVCCIDCLYISACLLRISASTQCLAIEFASPVDPASDFIHMCMLRCSFRDAGNNKTLSGRFEVT